MTESEWLVSRESHELLGFLQLTADGRRLRQFAVACCRRIWPHLTDERSRQAVLVAELDLERKIEDEERLAAARSAADALQQAFQTLNIRLNNGHLYHAAWAAALCLFERRVLLSTPIYKLEITGDFDYAMQVLVNSAGANAIWHTHDVILKAEKHAKLKEMLAVEYAEQADLIRRIFGNPFRPAAAE
jgi:hypothetical protein